MMSKKHKETSFRDIVHELGKKPATGDAGERSFNWGRKAKTSFRPTYTGNEGKRCQLPLSRRKKNVLKNIEEKKETGIWVKLIEPTVLKALQDDGSIYLHREGYPWGRPSGRFYTRAVSTAYPQPDKKERQRRRQIQQEQYKQRMADPYPGEVEEDNGPKRTIKWTKDKHQKLLLDAIMGQADEEVVKQVTRTKTKPKKITK
jgi:hypothetical protein